MKFFIVLLLASLASTSLSAVLPGPEDEHSSKTQHTDVTAQLTPTSLTSKGQASSDDPSQEPFISTEEVISSEDVAIESSKTKSQEAQPQPSTAQDTLTSAVLQPEETAGLAPIAVPATSSEGKLAKIDLAMGKDLDKMVKVVTNHVEGMIPGSNGIVKP